MQHLYNIFYYAPIWLFLNTEHLVTGYVVVKSKYSMYLRISENCLMSIIRMYILAVTVLLARRVDAYFSRLYFMVFSGCDSRDSAQCILWMQVQFHLKIELIKVRLKNSFMTQIYTIRCGLFRMWLSFTFLFCKNVSESLFKRCPFFMLCISMNILLIQSEFWTAGDLNE